MIRYNQAFKQNVQGVLCARLRLDENRQPVFGEEEGTVFYSIELSLDSPNAEKIAKVTYILDEATFWQPERESKDAKHAFREEITSYGDFKVRVEVTMGTGERFVQQALLSEMLEAGHFKDMTPAIEKAIEYLRNN
jgi:prokaryotic YEATS domain